jgi:sterol desaturase/sphingolipid hydroxylase (fatty acid hydroxylase superfamily)/creatinine amidohydrolase/Fe(II)-dependent formamide hydrolase-like protein
LELLQEPFAHFLRASDRVFWVYLLTAIGIAFVAYLVRSDRTSLRGFITYLVPKHIWTHVSTRMDIGYFFLNRVLFLLLFTPFVISIFPVVNRWTHDLLAQMTAPQLWMAPDAVIVIYAAVVILGLDFVRFFTHWLMHKVDFLWEFHKVHHSAEVLTPLTVYRVHPVDDLLALTLGASVLAVCHSTFGFFFVNDHSFWTFGNVTLVTVGFYVAGYNLRHSHVWISYGSILSRVFISPAQHQIHHSCKPQHIDKNMGFMFAFWDGLFGTLYVPETQEQLVIGLDDMPASHYQNPWDCYVRPFVANFGKHQKTFGVALGSLAIAATVSISHAIPASSTETVKLEELTWNEVQGLISAGYRTAIIPTGGVEQNGEHLILGKHNPIITYAAEEVALGLGYTLVAPTIAYVPEGSIEPPDGHMLFPGTLTLLPETFEAVLRDSAKSLAAHGFTLICFIGDSGGNQEAQEKIARALSQELAHKNVRVVNVGDYYYNNGQRELLHSLGFGDTEIGGHAGIRDSSELLYVFPQGVRTNELRSSGQRLGVSGSYWKSTPALGKKLMDLKIRAAIDQITGVTSGS